MIIFSSVPRSTPAAEFVDWDHELAGKINRQVRSLIKPNKSWGEVFDGVSKGLDDACVSLGPMGTGTNVDICAIFVGASEIRQPKKSIGRRRVISIKIYLHLFLKIILDIFTP